MVRTKTEAPAENAIASPRLLELATDMVTAYVSHNQVPSSEIGTVLRNFHATLSGLSGNPGSASDLALKPPAVPIKNSVGDDFIICLEDGKRLKMLKRYLRTRFDLTPGAYRAKWRLPSDYPMVAPAYSRKRSAFAKNSGLGTIPGGARRAKRGASRQAAG